MAHRRYHYSDMTIDQKLLQPTDDVDYQQLANLIKAEGKRLGFQQIGISDIDLSEASDHLQTWLANHYHGEMQYMARNSDLRHHPDQLLP
ncbi:MAG: hypothetical protein U1B30_05725, partial [Pseudomonadota bacterium]|nr:hypothetical protein [Pseudomonadota bacterium]